MSNHISGSIDSVVHGREAATKRSPWQVPILTSFAVRETASGLNNPTNNDNNTISS